MKGQDIVILLKLASLSDQKADRLAGTPDVSPRTEDPYSLRGLEASLGISKTEISASIKRSINARLAYKDDRTKRPTPQRRNLFEFIVHGLKYVFPVEAGTMTRGLPTGMSAPTLDSELLSANNATLVWPDPNAANKGLSITPLFRSVPHAAKLDNRLYEYLALVDSLRVGRQREVGIATEHLSQRILAPC